MQSLKVCFVGIGSIAKRHIANLNDICREKNIQLQIDALRRTRGSENITGISDIYTDTNDMPSDYDIIFITNPTQHHMDTLEKVNDKAQHFFIEKPLTTYDLIGVARDFSYKQDSVYYIACPLRYKKIIQEVKKIISDEIVLAVRAECSSYLPEWRPGTDYRNCYSARKELGGGVSIDLIHEWDYLQYLFGFPDEVSFVKGKFSDLEIDTEDYAGYIAKYSDKLVELHLDYFGRAPRRMMTIYTRNDTIDVDLLRNEIHFCKMDKTISYTEDRDDFQKKELEYFLSIIDGNGENTNNPLLACKTLCLTQGVV